MKWQKLDKIIIDNIKSQKSRMLVYAPEWDSQPYDILWFNGEDWSSVELSYEANSSTTYSDDELIKYFAYCCLIDQPERLNEETSKDDAKV